MSVGSSRGTAAPEVVPFEALARDEPRRGDGYGADPGVDARRAEQPTHDGSATDSSPAGPAAASDTFAEGLYAGDDAVDGPDRGGTSAARRGLLVVGLPLLALTVVIALAWWLGAGVLSVTRSVDEEIEGSTPTVSGTPSAEASAEAPADAPEAGDPVEIATAEVFDPFGDGQPENDRRVPQSFDGDPATVWSTLTYRGSPAFGNLKDGVGVVYDLGSEQELAGVTVRSTLPGSTVEVRAIGDPGGSLGNSDVLANGTLEESTDFGFDEAVTTRYVLVWITELVPSGDGFAADLAEVSPLAAG